MCVSSALSLYLIYFAEKYSAITTSVPQAVTWENIKLYFVSVYGFSGLVYERTPKKRVKWYAHCVAHNVWRYQKSKLYFSWSVTMPFYVMHVYIWSPSYLVNTKKDIIQLMNLMYDLTQFFISSVVRNINAEILAKTFMEEVTL